MSVRDVMATDWHDLMAILNVNNNETTNDNEPMTLEAFIGTL